MIILATSMNHKYAYSDFQFVDKRRINNLGVTFLARRKCGGIMDRNLGGNGIPGLGQPRLKDEHLGWHDDGSRLRQRAQKRTASSSTRALLCVVPSYMGSGRVEVNVISDNF